jgi:hypothetical protein
VPDVAATDEVGDPVALGIEAVKLGAATERQGLGGNVLELAVLTLDRAILVRDIPIRSKS